MLIGPLSSSNDPDWLLGMRSNSDMIEYRLEIPESVEHGEVVRMELILRNKTNHKIELRLRDYLNFFAVGDITTGELIWSSELLSPVVFLYMTPTEILEAGEEKRFEYTWDQTLGEFNHKFKSGEPLPRRDESKVGKQVEPGTYIVYGFLYFGIENGDRERFYYADPTPITIL